MPLLEQQRRPPAAAPARCLTRLAHAAERETATRWPALWAGCFMLGAAAGPELLPFAPQGWGSGGVARTAGLLPLLLAWRRMPAAAVGAVVLALAAAWGAGRAASLEARPSAAAAGPLAPARRVGEETAAVLRVTGFAGGRAGGGWRVPAVVLASAAGPGAAAPARGDGVLVSGEGDRPAAGDLVSARVAWRRPAAAAIRGCFDDRAYLAGRGLAWRGWTEDARVRVRSRAGRVLVRAREVLAAALADLLPAREARLAAAVLLGRRGPEHRRETSAFAALGLAHLFAVSGLHVGIVAAFLVAPLHLLGLPPLPRAALLSTALAAYMLLTGLPGSVVRAGGAVALAAAAGACGRPVDGLRLLGLLFWLVVMANPTHALDTGVRLSYLAAGGILVQQRVRRTGPAGGPVRWLGQAAGVSLAAQWGTLPVVAGAFGTLHPLATLANLAAVPAFAGAVGLLATALACTPLPGPLAADLAALAWLLLRALAGVTSAAAPATATLAVGLPPPSAPSVAAWLVLSVVLVAATARGGRLRLLLAPALVAGVVAFARVGRVLPPRDAPVAVQFDVGQGDAALVAFPDGWCALIDTGAPGREGGDSAFDRQVAPWLRRQGLRRLAAVVLTHGHADHTGGAADVARGFAVGRWHGGGEAGTRVSTGPAPWARPVPRRVLHRWGRWRLEILDPSPAGAPAGHENDASLVAVLWSGRRALMVWSGDLELAGEASLLSAGVVPAEVPIWKAGHHGSRTAGGRNFLARLAPRLVLVSCGVANRYGHPDHGPYVAGTDTAAVLRTDLAGTLLVRWRPDGAATVRSLRAAPVHLTPPTRVSTMRARDPSLTRRPVRDGPPGG